MSVGQIRNYIQMTNAIGTSGQPEAGQFQDIADAGYRLVVNLAMPDSIHAIDNEADIVAAAGMAYVHLPVPFDNPTAAHLRQFISIMDRFTGGKVWVHCAVNLRVSAFMYQYLRLAKGISAELAENERLKLWRPEMDEAWKKFMTLEKDDLA